MILIQLVYLTHATFIIVSGLTQFARHARDSLDIALFSTVEDLLDIQRVTNFVRAKEVRWGGKGFLITASLIASSPILENPSRCVYVCMYACMHACMYVCMYVCMHVCMHACMHACMYVCMHVCIMHACTYACMWVLRVTILHGSGRLIPG